MPRLRDALCAFAARRGAASSVVDAVRLAASEAMTNVVLHAYTDAPAPGELTAEAWTDGDYLIVTVLDAGSGIRPRPQSAGLGLGLTLMAQVARDFSVGDRTDGQGAYVRMRFALNPGGAAAS